MSEPVKPADPHGFPYEPVPFVDLVGQFRQIEAPVMDAVKRVFEQQAFILGDEVSEFECDLAEYCDSRDAIGCASGTDALILALMALDIGPGDEVITTPFTFFATASSICRVGATPIFVDIDPNTFLMNVDEIESKITSRTRAIMPVHIFGQCVDMEPIWRLSVKHGLGIIEDACQSIGASYQGRKSGVLGSLGCFSFFPTKNLGGAGDGGAITTDDGELARRVRRLRVHGESGQYQHSEVGLNSRLDALQAAVLRTKLEYLSDWTDSRRLNAQRYYELFDYYGLHDEVQVPTLLEEDRHVFNQFSIRVRSGKRDALLQQLRANGVGCSIYYPVPLHLQDCFESLGYQEGDFPESEAASNDVIALPIFGELTESHQETVVRTISRVLGKLTPSHQPQTWSGEALPLQRAA